MMIKFLLYAVIIYVALLFLVFVMQRQLLYFPSKLSPPRELVLASGLSFWPAEGDSYRGLISTDRIDDVRGTVIVFHGNAGTAVDRSYYVRALEPMGYRVLLAEYPGYGGRSGKPSEATLTADAKQTVAAAYNEFGQPIILWGESLGCGVATAVAAGSQVPIEAVVLLTPWDSLSNLAQSIYWYFPTRWLVADKFDNVSKLSAFEGSVAVILSKQDEVIPVRHGLSLYQSIGSNKKLWVFENAGHNSWPTQPEAPWWNEVMRFATKGEQN